MTNELDIYYRRQALNMVYKFIRRVERRDITMRRKIIEQAALHAPEFEGATSTELFDEAFDALSAAVEAYAKYIERTDKDAEDDSDDEFNEKYGRKMGLTYDE